MPEISARHAAIRHDIELALLTDPTPAGWVYVNLEGINPRIIAHTENKATLVAYTDRILAILKALHGEFRADPAQRMRGMKSNTTPLLSWTRRELQPAPQNRVAQTIRLSN